MTIAVGEDILKFNGRDLWYKVAGKGSALMAQPPGWGIGVGLYEQACRPLESEFGLSHHQELFAWATP